MSTVDDEPELDKSQWKVAQLTNLLRASDHLLDGDATWALDRREPRAIHLVEGVRTDVVAYIDADDLTITPTALGLCYLDLWRDLPSGWEVQS